MNKFATMIVAAGAAIAFGIGVGATSAAAAGGTITGTVKLDGTAPAPKKVEISKDKEVCGLKPHFTEDLIVDS